MKEHLEQFRTLLANATEAIGRDYFLLPVAGADGGEPIVHYRERVYAYELYHQLRQRWPDWPYSLGGEIDKRGHPIIREGFLKNAKPDVLVHVPGTMGGNLAVVEIKALRPEPVNDEADAILTDLRKLTAFRMMNEGYAAAFFIAFGEEVDRIQGYAEHFREAGIDLGLVELYHHPRPGAMAARVAWKPRT